MGSVSTSSVLLLLFVVAPIFSKVLKSVDVPAGTTLVLQCHVTGTPLPDISWYHDHKRLPLSHDVTGHGESSSVVIGRLGPEHSGEYVCEAVNVAGETSTSAVICVLGKGVLSVSNAHTLTGDF